MTSTSENCRDRERNLDSPSSPAAELRETNACLVTRRPSDEQSYAEADNCDSRAMLANAQPADVIT